MNVSVRRLIDAKEAAADLLERLGLEAYIFEVEPREGPWEVRIDCGHSGGWQSVTLAVDVGRLLASRENAAVRAQLLKDWSVPLAACRYPGPGPE